MLTRMIEMSATPGSEDATTSVRWDGPADRGGIREFCERIAARPWDGELLIDLTNLDSVDEHTARRLRRRLHRAISRRRAILLSDDLQLRMVLEAGWSKGLLVGPAPRRGSPSGVGADPQRAVRPAT
jgi:hypothetical protein